MKKSFIITMLLLIFLLAACESGQNRGGDEKVTGTTITNEVPGTAESEQPQVSPSSENTSSYRTRELSRDGDYKIMEMYVYDDSGNSSRRITFEIPAEWLEGGSVFTNGEDSQYTLKIDMWDVLSATRDDVLAEYEHDKSGESVSIISENIYLNSNYEIFQYKGTSTEGDANCFSVYYLYTNGERLLMSSYVFAEDQPEYDDIFMRIAESVKFQF